MPETQEDYGNKFDYDPLWKGPIEQNRNRTDFRFTVIFGIFLAFWAFIAIYAYSSGKDTVTLIYSNHGTIKSEINGNQIDTSRIFKISFGFLALGTVLSSVFIILVRWFAKLIVYTSLFIVCLALFSAVCETSYLYHENKNTGFLFLSIASMVTLLIVVIMILALRRKINIACEVIKESTKAVMFFPSSLLFPLLPALLYIVTALFAVSVFIYLNGVKQQSSLITVFHYINLFGGLWMFFFITAFSQMVLSGSFATWYWTFVKHQIPNNIILSFMGTGLKYHIGTLAIGSLILAVCQLINILLSRIRNQLQGCSNIVACLFFGWFKYIFGNLERVVRYINRNAYIMTAVHGTGFYQSAKTAFNLLMRNIIKVLVINKVTIAILFLGQLFVVGLSVAASYGWCYNNKLEDLETQSVLVIVLFGSLLITVAFFTVLRIAIDTIFLCVLEDYERNDGSEEKPYYMSLKLKTLLIKDENEF